jgi:hypothetical protein
LRPGDEVAVGDSSLEWPAFAFVACPYGEGWVPERHLTPTRPHAVLVVQYDTTELPVDPDDIVDVVERDDESGWWWCRSSSGAEGWVPTEGLKPLHG